ncbi:MAG: trypsin-like serine protease [Phycisphaerae bacterium]|nr:trypsin-like serine protease [Phycisphaerae bacterium]
MKARAFFPTKRASRLFAGAVAVLLVSAAFSGPAWAITGGEVDQNNTYRNVGAMVYAPPGSEPIVAHSGTLIHPRVVLTAGHCTIYSQQHPELTPDCYFSFGKNAFDPSTWLEIEAFITYPNYEPIPEQSPHDVGVIILKEPICNVPLANLPYAGFLDDLKKAKLLRQPDQGGAPFTVAGYGSTLDRPPPVITAGDGWRRFADSDYLALLPGWLLAQQNFATGNGGTGFGDSGGPAFWIEPDGTRVLVGITSWGDPNCVAMNFYWRVDIPETLDFIDWVINTVLPSLP